MQLIVNGEAMETSAQTLAELLGELGHAGQQVATAVNGDFVARPARTDWPLRAADRIEIVSPRQGG